MSIVGYASERLAAEYCEHCASKRWSTECLARGTETTYHTTTTGNVERTYNVHPIFSTDDTSDSYCDDCFLRIS